MDTKKVLVISGVILIIGVFVVFASKSSNQNSVPVTNDNSNTTTASSTSYKDGTYTGSVSDMSIYGPVQVGVVIAGGKITNVQFLQFPSGSGHTDEVTAMAEPTLKQEVIAAQSANIDIVSGATQDTQAFMESLQTALDQAKSS